MKDKNYIIEPLFERLERGGIQERTLDLRGPDGNAFVILGMAKNLAKQLARVNPEYNWEKIEREMTSGDYNNLVHTFERYFGDYVTIYGVEVLGDNFDDEHLAESLNDPKLSIRVGELQDYLKASCRSWEYDCNTFEDVITLFHILSNRFPDLPIDNIIDIVKHWVGFNDEHLTESYKTPRLIKENTGFLPKELSIYFLSWFTGSSLNTVKHPTYGSHKVTPQQIMYSDGKYKNALYAAVKKAFKNGTLSIEEYDKHDKSEKSKYRKQIDEGCGCTKRRPKVKVKK